MAKTVIGLEVNMNSSGAEGSVKSLKSQLREAQAEVSAIADKFGETSIQAAEAAKKAAALKDRIGDAKALTDAFNPDKKFQAFSSALSGVAGGFAAVQGAMALMGAESKDIEKTLLKVQSAMALSQGLSAITESMDAFKNLKTVAVNAMNSIKSAIGSTGIGLLVIAVGAIYAYWDDIKEAVTGVNEEMKKAVIESKKKLELDEKDLKSVDDTSNILKLQGKSEKDILKIKLQKISASIKDAEVNVTNQENIAKAQLEAEKRNYNILKNIARFSMEVGVAVLRVLSAPIDAIILTVNKVSEKLGFDKIISGTINEQITNLTTTGSDFITKMIFDPEKVKNEGDKTIQEAKDKLTKLKNDQAGYILQLKDNGDKEVKIKKDAVEEKQKIDNDESKKIIDNDKEKLIQQLHSEQLIQEARLALIKDANLKRIQEIENARQLEIDKELDALSKGLITQEQYNINRKAIDDKYNAQRDQQEAIRLQKIKDDAETQKKIDEEQYQAKIKLTKDVGDAMGALSEIIGKETAVGKGLAVAQATINTFLGATEVLRAKSVLPEPLGTISKVVNVATIIATGIKSVKSILSTKVPGGGGGGGSVPAGLSTAAPIGAQMGGTALQQAQINATGNAAVQAFVLESDVSGNQERIERLNRAARIQ